MPCGKAFAELFALARRTQVDAASVRSAACSVRIEEPFRRDPVARAQLKSEIPANGATDDGARESMAMA
jgi:hypothetical protein